MTHLPSLPHGILIDVFGRLPDIADRLHEFAEEVMRGPAPFTPGTRELMAAFVSRLNGCTFCERSHAAVAARFGADTAALEALVEDIDSAPIADDLKPVFHYLKVLTLRPDEVAAADVKAILDAGWDEPAVMHANLVCGFFALMNRLVEGLGIEANEKVVEMAGRQLHERGYRGVTRMLGSGHARPGA